MMARYCFLSGPRYVMGDWVKRAAVRNDQMVLPLAALYASKLPLALLPLKIRSVAVAICGVRDVSLMGLLHTVFEPTGSLAKSWPPMVVGLPSMSREMAAAP